MPTDFLTPLRAAAGIYQGPGINHENQNFIGTLVIRPTFHHGAVLWFRALGPSGEIFHEEISLIAPAITGGLALTSLNTNIPGLQTFRPESSSATQAHFIDGDFASTEGFRERVTLTLNTDHSITSQFAWGLPGQPVEPRSEATMQPTAGPIPEICPLRL